MTITYANGNTIVHAGDGLQFIAMAPDVCKTPSPGGPVPIPYPNIAMSSDLADGSKRVSVEGNPAALESSNLSTSSGDEAGTAGGGIMSSKTKGKLTWLLYSMDVKFEGKGVVRFLDSNMHNGNASNTGGNTRGKMTWPGKGGDIKCDNCGKAFDDPSHMQLKASSESDRHAQNTNGRTTAAVVVECPKSKAIVTTGVAGNQFAALNTNNFAKVAKNFKSGKAIPTKGPGDGSAPAGNCAEQKALFDSAAKGGFPLGEGCGANMSVMRQTRNSKAKVHVASCETCKRVVTSMLCTNDPN
jgi:Domain of unknown function (DUF4150)